MTERDLTIVADDGDVQTRISITDILTGDDPLGPMPDTTIGDEVIDAIEDRFGDRDDIDIIGLG